MFKEPEQQGQLPRPLHTGPLAGAAQGAHQDCHRARQALGAGARGELRVGHEAEKVRLGQEGSGRQTGCSGLVPIGGAEQGTEAGDRGGGAESSSSGKGNV